MASANGRDRRPSGSAGRKPGKVSTAKDTLALASAISQLFALKGYASDRGNAQLVAAWKELAGERIAERTAVLGVNRGVLQIGVSSAAMLGELASFHKGRLVSDLKARYPALKLRDIKFRLRGDLAKSPGSRANGRENKPTNHANQSE